MLSKVNGVLGMGRLITFIIGFVLSFEVLRATPSMCHDFYAKKSAQKIHQEIAETLFIGNVIHAKPFSANGNRNPLWLVTLKNPHT